MEKDELEYGEKHGLVFNIQHYSLHDGDGIRTTVFLKGCPLKCAWCANPESQSQKQELLYRHIRCISCRACAKACRRGAISFCSHGAIEIKRDQCVGCGQCVAACNTGAMTLVGEWMTAEELYREIISDQPFYKASGGGVTFSGGEPLMQHTFLKSILIMCKNAGLSTVIETCGAASREVFQSIIDHVDEFYYDLKLMDPKRHKELTGCTNELILENLCYLAEQKKKVLVRIPLIPGVNNDEGNLKSTGLYLKKIGVQRVQLLPYHAYGASKYAAIGRNYLFQSHAPNEKEMQFACERLQEYGICVKM